MTHSPADDTMYDVAIIGGGFYGCYLALHLHRSGSRAVILERGPDLLTRASYANQARVHNGYHYPRSFMTAWRSFVNFPRFVMDFHGCIDNSFEKIYAVARQNSKVNAFQFKRMFQHIGAPIKTAPPAIKGLFNPRMIEEVFVVKEFAFDAVRLRALMRAKLDAAGVPVLLGSAARAVRQAPGGALAVALADGRQVCGRHVFNCTYAQINSLLKQSDLPLLPLKHEVTEMALVRVPEPLQKLGITVMDGPFFSVMPFPSEGLHTLSHVRYTPHEAWVDLEDGYRDPYGYLEQHPPRTNVTYMLRDAQRYLPVLGGAEYARSLFEIKTVLVANENDDGRPILFRKNYGLDNFHSMMGGKIDNIYDMLERMHEFTERLAVKEQST